MVGLKGVEYMDSLQDKKRLTESGDSIAFTDELDRIYLQTPDVLEVRGQLPEPSPVWPDLRCTDSTPYSAPYRTPVWPPACLQCARGILSQCIMRVLQRCLAKPLKACECCR